MLRRRPAGHATPPAIRSSRREPRTTLPGGAGNPRVDVASKGAATPNPAERDEETCPIYVSQVRLALSPDLLAFSSAQVENRLEQSIMFSPSTFDGSGRVLRDGGHEPDHAVFCFAPAGIRERTGGSPRLISCFIMPSLAHRRPHVRSHG
ncbi:hypothetical protein CSOJ01_04211 [Colletotrichum sojae]|uniref:Uncharacterized protein n=1 Tax=Colletotrichum sojae TaxID=2175907 RepID=A0A8H6MYX5_9PEZI|nr:hypothetical protein CSOJ01_04211 [Colletotrichum sojae]